MDSTSLTKPVNLQGLSLALAKTKADYEAKIDNAIAQSDWEVENEDYSSYILNKPAIKAGDGENSIVEGSFTQESTAAIYTIYITGAARATTFSYTTSETLPSLLFDEDNRYCAYIESGASMYKNQLIASINSSNSSSGSITFPHYVSTSALSNAEVKIFYNYTIALGKNSHISGEQCVALGVNSYAHGYYSYAIGTRTCADGNSVKAYGSNSHAEGSGSITFGDGSHAEGLYTIARGMYQHVQGKYNIEDTNGTYADIVGNGTSSTRSNAYTLDWSGNGWYAGKLTVGADPVNDMDVATKQYVDEHGGTNTVNVSFNNPSGIGEAIVGTTTVGNDNLETETTYQSINDNYSNNALIYFNYYDYHGQAYKNSDGSFSAICFKSNDLEKTEGIKIVYKSDETIASSRFYIPVPEDDENILNLLSDYGFVSPISDASGSVIVDVDGNLILG